jgi:hypothetical protein
MTDIHLDGPLQRARGVIGRYPQDGERYVMSYEKPRMLAVHMLGVRRPLLVEWLLEDDFVTRAVLQPWVGSGQAWADTVIESAPEVGAC